VGAAILGHAIIGRMHGATDSTWRVAVVGAGPSAFYAAEALFKALGNRVRVDMFDRLPVPYGLVRGGVAPDHQNIKGVVKVYEKIAAQPGFRFFGNVRLGRDVHVADLTRNYHQIVYGFGCESDQKLGLIGEELGGVHAATDFVGWYNGHPDHVHHRFDLADAERVAVVGNGNVAMDVARILLSQPERLAATDIAEHALAALQRSQVREVVLLGRRGPAQAAFSPKELEEIAELPDVGVHIPAAEAQLSPACETWLTTAPRSQQRNAKLVAELAAATGAARSRTLQCRFRVAPVALHGADGRLQGVRLQRMELVPGDDGTPRPQPIDEFEELRVDLLFKAIGYKGVPVPGVPYEPKKGIVPNVDGRVTEKAGGAVLAGHYAVGWCKRGPTGLIGTNSPDAKATVEAMLTDQTAGSHLQPTTDDLPQRLRSAGVDLVGWQDWERLDAWERSEGERRGKLRHKLTSTDAMLQQIRALRTTTAP
jgi:ferredoxin--NADP+ reductase